MLKSAGVLSIASTTICCVSSTSEVGTSKSVACLNAPLSDLDSRGPPQDRWPLAAEAAARAIDGGIMLPLRR